MSNPCKEFNLSAAYTTSKLSVAWPAFADSNIFVGSTNNTSQKKRGPTTIMLQVEILTC